MPIGWPDGAAVFDDVLVVGTDEHVVRGIAISAGTVEWCVELEAREMGFTGGLVAAGPYAAAISGRSVVALDPASGEERWRRGLTEPYGRLQGGDVLWVFDGSANPGTPHALDPLTGADLPAPGEPPSMVPGFGSGAPPTAASGFELIVEPVVYNSGRQEMSVSVSADGTTAWTAVVPGFVAGLVDSRDEPVVVVIDQTGGTGDVAMMGAGADTRLTAYTAATGAQLWQIALPGTPHLIAPISPDLVVIPVGTSLHALDPATGTTLWVGEQPSPGQSGTYNLPGSIWFAAPGRGSNAVAIARAEEPYRD